MNPNFTTHQFTSYHSNYPMIKASRRLSHDSHMSERTRVPIIVHTEDSQSINQSIKGQRSKEASRNESNGSGGDQTNTNLTQIAEVDTEDSYPSSYPSLINTPHFSCCRCAIFNLYCYAAILFSLYFNFIINEILNSVLFTCLIFSLL